ncbi:hypothetical protein [Simiduia litorea]|uniref:hypothetical protein n=1 Tax=Simiduia litorea TaxID=1435348 RepID=UPI0036F23AAB
MSTITRCVLLVKRALMLVLVAAGVMGGAQVMASSVQVTGTATTFTAAATTDMLDVAAPNQQQVSVNRFSRFEVTGRPLSITNLSSSVNGELADLIVIIADDIVINAPITILGPAADLLFISPTNGVVQCSACQFNNVYRVSLVSVQGEGNLGTPQSVDGAIFGTLTASSGGSVIVSTLDAPGALAVDLVAANVQVSGVVNTHQRANRTTAGSYKADLNGSYTIGAGGVNVVGAAAYWNYDAQRVNGYISGSAASANINASLSTTALKIFANDALVFAGSVNTSTSINSAVRYRGNTRITEEQVSVTQVGENAVNVQANVISNGAVSFMAGGNVIVPIGKAIKAGNLTLISSKRIENYGAINAGVVEGAAEAVRNEGSIDADAKIELWANKSIVNHRGGAIRSHTVSLESENGYVLNGSRTPFKYESEEFIPYPANYTNSLNPIKLGTFYANNTEALAPVASQAKFSKSSAHIAGAVVKIKAQAFENINPYYLKLLPDEQPLLDRELLAQVSVIAEQNMKIKGDKYLVNASALLGVQSSTGLMELDAPQIINERYRVLSLMDQDHTVVTNSASNGYGYNYQSSSSEVYKTVVATYSPPGLMFSMGRYSAMASSEYVNAVGYVELFGDAEFSTGTFADIGLEHGQVQKDLTVTSYYGGYCSYGCTAQQTASALGDPQEMDSLFYVGGNVKVSTQLSACAASASACFLNVSSFDAYLNMAIDQIVASNSNYRNEQDFGGVDYVSYSKSFQISGLDDFDDKFYISWNEIIEKKILVGEVFDTSTAVKQGVDEYSIWQVMKNLYQQVVTWWTDLTAEINWWN